MGSRPESTGLELLSLLFSFQQVLSQLSVRRPYLSCCLPHLQLVTENAAFYSTCPPLLSYYSWVTLSFSCKLVFFTINLSNNFLNVSITDSIALTYDNGGLTRQLRSIFERALAPHAAPHSPRIWTEYLLFEVSSICSSLPPSLIDRLSNLCKFTLLFHSDTNVQYHCRKISFIPRSTIMPVE